MIALIAGPSKPPRFAQGLGLPYLGAVLEEAGFEPRIFDLYPPSPDTDDTAVLDERLAEVLAEARPEIVGMTIHTPEYAARVRLARLVRERLPEVLLVAGGHHPTAEPEDLIRNTDFDVCVSGEGEETLLEIARRVGAGSGRGAMEWLDGIAGVVYSRDGEVVHGLRRRNPDVDSLPQQAHHLLGLADYNPHPALGMRSVGVVTYRGCPKRCAFCLNPQGHRVRHRSVSLVVDEMARVVQEFGINGFNVYDNLFGLTREHSLAICEEIVRRRLKVVWDCWTAGDLVDAELAERMRAAGCIRVGFGAESGDDEVLAKSHRGFTAAQHQAGLDALHAAGLKTQPFLMVGLPGESEESVRRTVEFAKRCGADEVELSLHRPYPGTALWQRPEEFGVRIIRGPNFEASLETQSLSREAMLATARNASDELKSGGVGGGDFLRWDVYDWE